MEGEGGGGAAGAAVLAVALPPGHALGDCDPETQEGLEKWLKTLGGKIAADAAPFLKLLEDEGVFRYISAILINFDSKTSRNEPILFVTHLI